MARGLKQKIIGNPLSSGTMNYSLNAPLSSGGVSPLGSLFSGLVQGFLGQQQLAKQQEQTQLQHELGKSRIKLMEEQLKYQATANKLMEPYLNQLQAGGIQETNLPEPNNPSLVPGQTPSPSDVQPQEMPVTMAPVAPPVSSMKSKMTGPGGLPLQGFTLGGATPRLRFGNERQGVGVESQMFAIRRKMETNSATPEEISLFNNWIKTTMPVMAGARAGGAETGRQKVRGTPEFQQTERDVTRQRGAGRAEGALGVRESPRALQATTATATAETAGRAVPESSDTAITSMRTILQQLDKVDPQKPEGLYSDEFVGPFASIRGGVKEKFGETPGIGGLVGGPISENEAKFRQIVNSVYNEIANLRGGKVLPEQELRRIEKEAVTLTNSPQSFKSRYTGFKGMIEQMLQNRTSIVGATRSTVGGVLKPQGGAPSTNAPVGTPARGKPKILSIEPMQ